MPNDKKIQLFFLEAIAAKLKLSKGNRIGSRLKVPKNTSFFTDVSSFVMLDACSSLQYSLKQPEEVLDSNVCFNYFCTDRTLKSVDDGCFLNH